jgi:antitoxin (DNA-binding transcriptional repressor) of toxin-antitoxin stability system
MRSRISATHAARTFSDLLNRVVYRGEEFLVVRGRTPVCEITGLRTAPRARLGQLAEVLREAPRPDDLYFDELAALVTNQPVLRGDPWDH